MKFNKIYSLLGILSIPFVSASSRSDFYGKNDNRPELFKILDDKVGTIKISLDDEIWTSMKKKTEVPPWSAQFAEDFETMNATMEFFVPGTDYRVELESGKFKFAIGGKGSRNFSKPGYNIKLEEGSIYEVKNLRLRSNSRDPTLLREKLSTDMLYKMGLPTTSTNFVNLEVNGEDLGLFIVTNKIKKDFIKRYFNDKNTDNLFECLSDHNRFETYEFANSCQNAKEELAANKEEIINFNNAINNATSVEDIEKVLDVDNFLRYIAYEFLTLSWDHFLGYNHNFFWYKKKEDGRFIMILNDFDETFGADFSNIIFLIYNQYADRSYMPGYEEMYVPNTAFRDIDLDHKIMKYLVHDDDTRFRRIIGEVVKQVFNPKVLNARIDELAELIHDDMANSRSIDEKTGYCRGCFNTIGLVTGWNITHFEDGVSYGNWISNASYTYSPSLKFFIEGRFKYICHTYGIDPETLELIEPRPKVSFWGIKNKYKVGFNGTDFNTDDFIKYNYPDLDKEDFMQESYNADPEKNNKPVNYEYTPHRYDLEENEDKEDATVSTTVADIEIETSGTTTVEATSSPSKTVETIEPVETSKDCWSEKLGYSCCQTSCHVYETDEDGEWGYEEGHWCGIPSTCSSETCWSVKYGYSCCETSCNVYETDAAGDWGYEDHHWCGINKEKCTNN
jgi:hypothetical protein